MLFQLPQISSQLNVDLSNSPVHESVSGKAAASSVYHQLWLNIYVLCLLWSQVELSYGQIKCRTITPETRVHVLNVI